MNIPERKLEGIRSREKKTRARLVGDEGGIQRNGRAVGTCDGDKLISGVEAGSYDQKSVDILEGNTGSFSVDGAGGGTLETTAADG